MVDILDVGVAQATRVLEAWRVNGIRWPRLVREQAVNRWEEGGAVGRAMHTEEGPPDRGNLGGPAD